MWVVLPICILWLAAWLTRPQRPYGMGQDAFLVYRRAQSQWEWYRAAAIVLTAGMLLLLLLAHRHSIDPNMARLRAPYVGDAGGYGQAMYKWTLQTDGTWKMVAL
jgi:hypothetical protein